MEPTEENRRAWDELHRLRVEATTDRPGLPAPIRALLPDIGGKRVLHELCGTGETSADLAALGGLVTAIDVWEPPLVLARERYPEVLFVQADPHALPVNLRRRRFDLVVAGGLLPYVYDLELWAGEAAAALRVGGHLFLYDLHPALACVDAASLRWRDDYFGGAIVVGTRLGPVRTLRLWRLRGGREHRRRRRLRSSAPGRATDAHARQAARSAHPGRLRPRGREELERRPSGLAHEPLARCADERDRLGEQDAHGVTERKRLLVDRPRDLDALERGRRQVDGRVQRQRGELLALRLRDRLGLVLGELAQAAEQILGVSAEREV